MSTLKRRRFRKRWEHGYGFFPGGDPRRFRPDGDSSQPAHRAACAAADAGDRNQGGSCVHLDGLVLTVARFGIGSYAYPVRERGNPTQRQLIHRAAVMAFDAEVLGLPQPRVKRGQRR